MTNKAKQVVTGFDKLSKEEKTEFLEVISRYLELEKVYRFTESKTLLESFSIKAHLGPLGMDGCPCCGKR